MKQIIKYVLPVNDGIVLFLPVKFKPVFFGNQNNKPTLWIEVGDEVPSIKVMFSTRMTGQFMPDYLIYIGTALFDNDSFVLHCYMGV